jgi:ferric-dicitrate binding protein FerR (iron transport regulator)
MAAYLSGEMSAAESGRFEEMVRSDPSLEREIAGLRAVVGRVASLAGGAGVERIVLDEPPAPRRRAGPSWTLGRALALAAALALAFIVGFAAGRRDAPARSDVATGDPAAPEVAADWRQRAGASFARSDASSSLARALVAMAEITRDSGGANEPHSP